MLANQHLASGVAYITYAVVIRRACDIERSWKEYLKFAFSANSREVGLFPLEQAVRRMTTVPARVFGLADRGALREGTFADLVLPDADTVIDSASFE